MLLFFFKILLHHDHRNRNIFFYKIILTYEYFLTFKFNG